MLFARAKCTNRLLGFSCKGRWFCYPGMRSRSTIVLEELVFSFLLSNWPCHLSLSTLRTSTGRNRIMCRSLLRLP